MSLLKLDPTDRVQNVLIVGATGYVGCRLVAELLHRGHNVTVYVRNPKRAPQEWEGRVNIITGEIDNEDDLQSAMKDKDCLYWLVHSLGFAGEDWANEDHRLAKIANSCARDAGVGKIIYLSGLGQESGASEHLNSRHETGKILAQGIEMVELRAAIIIGSGSLSWALVRDLSHRLPIMVTPRWVKSLCEPISIRDVLHHLILALEHDELSGVYEIGSGEVYTYGDLLKLAARVQGKHVPKMLPVPFLTPKLSSWWLHFVTSVDQKTAQPLIEGLKEDTIVTGRRLVSDYQHLPILEAMKRAWGAEKQRRAVSYWFERTSRYEDNPKAHASYGMDMTRISDTVSSETAWKTLTESFGNNYGHAQRLWKIRGGIDRILGGPGMRITRPNRPLRVGDAFDFWRVEDIQEGEYLQLLALMKTPGAARLRIVIQKGPENDGCIVSVRSSLEDCGFFGRVYWYSLLPFHNMIFNQILKGIAPDGYPGKTTPV